MPIAFSRRMRASARMQAVICIGYTLLLFACQLSVWGGMKLSARSGFDILPLLTWWSVPLLASIGLTLLALGAWSMKRRLVPAKRPRPLQTCSVSCAACAALLLGYGLLVFSPPASPPFACAGGLVLGWGAGMLLMEWAAVYARMAPDKATPSVLAALVASSFLCIVLGPLPTAVLEAAFAASSIVSTCLLAYAQRAGALRNVQGFSEQSPSLGETPSSRERARRGSSAPSKDGAPSGSEAGRREDPASKDALKRGGAGPVAPRTASLLAKETLGALSNPLFCAAAIAFAAAITRMMTLRTRPDSGEMVGVAGAACVIVGAAILLFALRRRESDRSPLLGIPTLFRILFPLVATLLLALSIGGEKLELPVGATGFSVYTIMSALMVPACIETAQRKGMRASAVYGLFAGSVYAVFSGTTLLGVQLFAEGGGFGATTSLVATLLVLYVLAMAFALVQRRTSGSESGECAPLSEASREVPADGRDPSPCASAPGPRAAGHAADMPDPIEQRCLVLAEQRGLSPRETDVLVAFAHGRNVAYLAEQLCLSTNTIRSHSKTLYTKLGVHNKQELIDLVDAAEGPRLENATASQAENLAAG